MHAWCLRGTLLPYIAPLQEVVKAMVLPALGSAAGSSAAQPAGAARPAAAVVHVRLQLEVPGWQRLASAYMRPQRPDSWYLLGLDQVGDTLTGLGALLEACHPTSVSQGIQQLGSAVPQSMAPSCCLPPCRWMACVKMYSVY